MLMKRLIYLWIAGALLAACSTADEELLPQASPLLMGQLEPRIERSQPLSRAEVDEDYVGRSLFERGDSLTMTTIKRTDYPLEQFSYTRKKWTLADLWETDADRIYWSDATSGHTFVGYSLPKQAEGQTFDWERTPGSEGLTDTYTGSLGKKDETGVLDLSTAEKLKHEDLLLSYGTDVRAEQDGIKVIVPFRHALSQILIEVSIGDFSAGATSNDNEVVVSDLVVKDQPMRYQWQENSPEDQDAVHEVTSEQQRYRDVKPWIRLPEGVGTGASKRFEYRMLAVPGTRNTGGKGLTMSFNVTYPNPLIPSEKKTDTYQASLEGKLTLYAGKVTVVKVRLNHRDDKPTVGAEYHDWEFKPIPDRGELTKNSTFLASVERSSVKLSSDGVTYDNATWLYYDSKGNLVDLLDNTGELEKPYKITTANQLLALAYEVNDGIDFTGKYIRLDASLTLQPFETYNVDGKERLVWPGIGTTNKPFNGVFFAGQGSLSHLYGSPLFGCVGTNGWLEQVTLTDVLGITSGRGILADKNQGLFCACRVEGDITSSQEKVGGLAGENEGAILLSVHIGDVKGINEVGGIAGTNCGYIAASLHAGAVTATTEAESATVNGIAQNVKGTISVGEIGERNGKVDGSYYDKTLFPLGNDNQGKSTTEMQSKIFVDELNTYINEQGNWSNLSNYLGDNHAYKGHYQYGQKHQFVYSPLQYPRIVNATSSSGGTQK